MIQRLNCDSHGGNSFILDCKSYRYGRVIRDEFDEIGKGSVRGHEEEVSRERQSTKCELK